MADIKVAVINASQTLTDAQVEALMPTLQTQVHRDFAPVWGIDADLSYVPKSQKPQSGAWWLSVLDNSDQCSVLGLGDVTHEGLPLGKVFANTEAQCGTNWTVKASHELLEMLADPDINLAAYANSTSNGSRLYAYEICDPCEADEFGYRINGMLLSDFVYPAWFESFRQSTKFDFTNHIQTPFTLLPGGYIGIHDIRASTGWQQLTSADRPQGVYRSFRPPVGSRRERRRTPRGQWQTSHFLGMGPRVPDPNRG